MEMTKKGGEMDKVLKELTLLLIYLTSWQEKSGSVNVQRSWKGYSFEILDKLNEEGYISSSKKAKSVYLTEEGINKAKELMKNYISENK
jgi:hypothetical protein